MVWWAICYSPLASHSHSLILLGSPSYAEPLAHTLHLTQSFQSILSFESPESPFMRCFSNLVLEALCFEKPVQSSQVFFLPTTSHTIMNVFSVTSQWFSLGERLTRFPSLAQASGLPQAHWEKQTVLQNGPHTFVVSIFRLFGAIFQSLFVNSDPLLLSSFSDIWHLCSFSFLGIFWQLNLLLYLIHHIQ